MTRTLHHVDLNVSDITAARRFYKPVMEFLGYKMTVGTAQALGFESGGDDGTGIMLHAAHQESRDRKHDRYAPGLHHLAFRAASRDEVDALHRVLQQIGATILDPPAVYYPPNYYAVFFADPDGLKFELAFNPGAH